MLQEALDFQVECDELASLLERLDKRDWQRETQFKHWTVDDLIAHLHLFNYAADLALQDSDAFTDLIWQLNASARQAIPHLAFTHVWLNGIRNRDLMFRWRDFCCDDFCWGNDPPFYGRRSQKARSLGRPHDECPVEHHRSPYGNLGSRPRHL
jgi:Mycothiol maleylpyruvate isomerase N-terminal domain